MTEPDPFPGQWRDISSVLADRPTTPTADITPDRRINRLRARAEEKRTNRHDAIQARSEERRTLREERCAERADARALRAEKREDRADSADRVKSRALNAGRSILVTAPILSPMAVAWTGQSQFAIQILGWAFAASVLYAAAYELTTVYWAWLYHQARSDGDSGWEYRLGTWIFATGAAVQQWWHYSDHWNATPRAVTYSLMSAVGVLLWEGRARLIHRRKLRSEGKLAPARPSIGLARWIRYPVHSWTAWSLITLEGHRTLDAAWTAADAALRSKAADRTVRDAAKETVRLDRTARSDGRFLARSAGPDRGPEPLAAHPGRTALPAHTAGPDRAAIVTAGVDLTKADRTARPSGPDRSSHQRTASVDRRRGTGPTDTPKPLVDHGPQMDRTPDDAGPDRTGDGLILNDTEQQAIDILRSTSRSISKRSIADVVRTELGRSIASDRAADIARHFRTLRSAA